MVSESDISKQLQIYASSKGHRLWRNNSGAFRDATGRMIRYGLGNTSSQINKRWKSSDLIGCTNDGRFVAIEVKSPDWVYRDSDERAVAQLKFIETIRSLDGLAGFARNEEELERIFNNER